MQVESEVGGDQYEIVAANRVVKRDRRQRYKQAECRDQAVSTPHGPQPVCTDQQGTDQHGFTPRLSRELGAVIESVAFPERNEIEDRELLDCIDGSLMSMLLPPGSADGREALELTFPL